LKFGYQIVLRCLFFGMLQMEQRFPKMFVDRRGCTLGALAILPPQTHPNPDALCLQCVFLSSSSMSLSHTFVLSN
jgi:hypothetical protein